MNIPTFILECEMRGVRFIVNGDALQIETEGGLKPATAKFIRQHKPEIIEALSDQQHGFCIHCGTDTAAMLTKPGTGWMWCCPECFDKGAASCE